MMKQAKMTLLLLIVSGSIAACGNNETGSVSDTVQAPEVNYKPAATAEGTVSKPGAPFTLQYKVIGTPIIGSPVPIELRVFSAFGDQPIKVSYNINDATALQFPDAQPPSVNITPAVNEEFVEQMVTVIPLREGRQYVNVSVSIESEGGSRSMVMAVPIQVGEGVRELEQNGELSTDEAGESIRVLPGESQ
jgi:predicted small secreted protein